MKTDNDNINSKLELRADVLSLVENPVILECFAGTGFLWNTIKEKNIKYFDLISIEIEKQKHKKAHLTGDSFKYLKTMDLSVFNIIDLDAYGIPFNYMDYIFNSNFKGYVIVTAIQSGMGRLPNELLYRLGYTKNMLQNITSIFNEKGLEKLKNYLYLAGVKQITGYFINRKYYFYYYKN